MTLKIYVPRASPFRILSLLFVATLTLSFGIITEHTLAPNAKPPARSSVVAESCLMPASGDAELDRIIVTAGARHGVDPQLIHAVIWKESNYRRHARSSQGAHGLMQLMPETARRFGCRNTGDATANVEAGTRYLRTLLERFDGDVKLALAGYNAGEGSVDKYRGIPPYTETRNFVRQIVARYGKTHHTLG